jgi:mono/diheme cytochrome c family protein
LLLLAANSEENVMNGNPSCRYQLRQRTFFGVALVVGFSWSILGRAQPTWGENEEIPAQGRSNPLEYTSQELKAAAQAGRHHALHYPVTVTGELLPLETALRFFKPETNRGPLFSFLETIFKRTLKLSSFDALENLVGLVEYPEAEGSGAYYVPMPEGKKPWYRMGTSVLATPQGQGITFSCAACHAGNLFGKKVIGLTNRFPRANEFFLNGKMASHFITPQMFQWGSQSSPQDTQMFAQLRENARFVDGRMPLVRGLDTSLAHVALSLSRRADDGFASKTPETVRQPRDNLLREQPADSKPAVWWNVKFKNKWLLDGSVVAGNPIFTNILWNELGRGTDLAKLAHWLDENQSVVNALTAVVFSAQAPEFLDFFPEEHFDLAAVKEGQRLFSENCAFCHGTYVKGFQKADSAGLSQRELLKTIRVEYHTNTPVVDVGTDPLRAEGMNALAGPLNALDISRRNGIVVKVQQGYVPPPLVGIWARWPYMHNNSIPSLCAVLTPAKLRPVAWDVGEARSRESDFDRECNGYPLGEMAPAQWQNNRWGHFDTHRRGLGNQGHDEGIVTSGGKEKFTPEQKRALIQFLQTL